MIGGDLHKSISSCVKFSTTYRKWNKIAEMKIARSDASCVVFEGRIVVSGGHNNNFVRLNTVEAYDHIDNSWTNMPNMIKRRCSHKTVAIKNKLFIVGGLVSFNFEVFDSCSNKFVLLKYESTSLLYAFASYITTLGKKVIIFNNKNGSITIYDVENNELVEKICEATQHIKHFSCAKIP